MQGVGWTITTDGGVPLPTPLVAGDAGDPDRRRTRGGERLPPPLRHHEDGDRRLERARARPLQAAARGADPDPAGPDAADGGDQRLRRRAHRLVCGRGRGIGDRGQRARRDRDDERPRPDPLLAEPPGQRDRGGHLRRALDPPARRLDLPGPHRPGGDDHPARDGHPLPAPPRTAERVRLLCATRAADGCRPGLLPASRDDGLPAGRALGQPRCADERRGLPHPLRRVAADLDPGCGPRHPDEDGAARDRTDRARAADGPRRHPAPGGKPRRRDARRARPPVDGRPPERCPGGGRPVGVVGRRGGDRRPRRPGPPARRYRSRSAVSAGSTTAPTSSPASVIRSRTAVSTGSGSKHGGTR